jgi:type II secretory pathway component PulF
MFGTNSNSRCRPSGRSSARWPFRGFARTLGTLVSSGVPILQALTIVKETAGNVIIANAVVKVHESVKEGETITAPLEASGVFPPMVVSMVDVGEQTGAMPEMLLKIADNYDEEVDNAVSAMTSLLEPIMIVFLAVIVGSIVIAMFLPLIAMISNLERRRQRWRRQRITQHWSPKICFFEQKLKKPLTKCSPCVNTL